MPGSQPSHDEYRLSNQSPEDLGTIDEDPSIRAKVLGLASRDPSPATKVLDLSAGTPAQLSGTKP